MKPARLLEDLFWEKTALIPFHTCWEWIGHRTNTGYGTITTRSNRKEKNIRISAHRFSFELFNGPLLPGLFIDHICRNRGCVNPQHLRQVTPRINSLENSISPHAQNKAKTHCKRGHEFNLINTGRQKSGRYCKQCLHDKYWI